MPRRRHLAIMLTHYACGDKKARSPGRARHRPLKPFACGNAGMSWRTRGDLLACFFHLHARLRVRFAPGIPHALFRERQGFFGSTRMRSASREGEGVSVLPLSPSIRGARWREPGNLFLQTLLRPDGCRALHLPREPASPFCRDGASRAESTNFAFLPRSCGEGLRRCRHARRSRLRPGAAAKRSR